MALDIAPAQIEGTARDLDRLIRARTPIISLTTHEEQRARRLLMQLRRGNPQHARKSIYQWSRTRGLKLVDGPDLGLVARAKPIEGTQDPMGVLEAIPVLAQQLKPEDPSTTPWGAFIELCDFGPHLTPYGQEDPVLARALRELAWDLKGMPVNVVMIGAEAPQVATLEKEIVELDLPLPERGEVELLVQEHLDRLLIAQERDPRIRISVPSEVRDRIVGALLGLTETEVEGALAQASVAERGLSSSSIALLLETKRQIIKRTGSLSFIREEPESSIGGYAHLRAFLRQAAKTFTPRAAQFGVEPAKGPLVVGLPGTGKDLLMRVASSVLGKPLLTLDLGAVMGSHLGSSEQNIRTALKIADALKPVMGIREFEKVTGGGKSSNETDGGTTSRVNASLLNWMSDQAGTFVMASANDVRRLDPEQIREGRFSRTIFVDLPDPSDRAEIFAVHLRKRDRAPELFDLGTLADASEGFSGAEIEAAVKAGILDAFDQDAPEVATSHLLAAASRINPIGRVKRQQIEEIRQWAAEHLGAVSASDPKLSATTTRADALEL